MFGTYQRLGVSVSASGLDVIRAARLKIAKAHRRGLAKRAERKAFYRLMLGHHASARALVLTWGL